MALPENPLILIVDDNAAVARITYEMLAAAGYQPVLAQSGEEAVNLCGQFSRPVDLVISDVVMPGMSGPELCRQLALARRALRCLLISGYSREHLEDSAPGADAFPMLVKPYTMFELLDTVRGLLAQPAPERAHSSDA